MRTHQIDFDIRSRMPEVAQDGHREMGGERRRHLHAQRTQRADTLVADIVEREFQAVEGFHHRREQMLTGLGQHQRVRAALEELYADQLLERDHVARQRALRNQQRIRRGREAQVLRDALERAQRVQRQPASIHRSLAHTLQPQGDQALV